MPYADYDFYTTFYKGNLIPEDEYSKYALRASKYIEKITHGRIKALDADVKICTCEIAEYYFENGFASAKKTSESVGSYSVAYEDSNVDDELRAICNMWLPAELMYRGASKCSHEV